MAKGVILCLLYGSAHRTAKDGRAIAFLALPSTHRVIAGELNIGAAF